MTTMFTEYIMGQEGVPLKSHFLGVVYKCSRSSYSPGAWILLSNRS